MEFLPRQRNHQIQKSKLPLPSAAAGQFYDQSRSTFHHSNYTTLHSKQDWSYPSRERAIHQTIAMSMDDEGFDASTRPASPFSYASASDSDSPTTKSSAKKAACLRQYKCSYPGCTSWRTNKRNNMERHVWTQHVRCILGCPDQPYIARLHKQSVVGHLVPTTKQRLKGTASKDSGVMALHGRLSRKYSGPCVTHFSRDGPRTAPSSVCSSPLLLPVTPMVGSSLVTQRPGLQSFSLEQLPVWAAEGKNPDVVHTASTSAFVWRPWT